MGRRSDRKRLKAKNLVVRKSILGDAIIFAPLLRDADVLEVDASSNMTAKEALYTGIKLSDPCYTAYWCGKPLAIFGVFPFSMPEEAERFGSIWLLGTDMIDTMGLGFLRVSKGWVEELLQDYVGLCNYVDVRNSTHIKWLEWLGADFRDPEPYGPYDLPFKPFYLMNTCVTP